MSKERIIGSLSFVVVIVAAMYTAKLIGFTTLTKQTLWTLGILTVYSIIYENVTSKLARKKTKNNSDKTSK